jgi:hypothetical protein
MGEIDRSQMEKPRTRRHSPGRRNSRAQGESAGPEIIPVSLKMRRET